MGQTNHRDPRNAMGRATQCPLQNKNTRKCKVKQHPKVILQGHHWQQSRGVRRSPTNMATSHHCGTHLIVLPRCSPSAPPNNATGGWPRNSFLCPGKFMESDLAPTQAGPEQPRPVQDALAHLWFAYRFQLSLPRAKVFCCKTGLGLVTSLFP